MKSLPMIVEPVYDNDSKVVSLTDIPVPIPSVRSAGPSRAGGVTWRALPGVGTPRSPAGPATRFHWHWSSTLTLPLRRQV
jgi:hypothetical protein